MLKTASKLDVGTRRGRVGLTPMVDVVFLLLVFFMLAAQYGDPSTALRLATGAAEDGETQADAPPPEAMEGPPRLVSVTPEKVRVNGFVTAPADLAAEVAKLMPTPDAVIILRPVDGASLQRVVEVIDLLRAGGIGAVVLTE